MKIAVPMQYCRIAKMSRLLPNVPDYRLQHLNRRKHSPADIVAISPAITEKGERVV